MLTIEFKRRERGWSQTQLAQLVRIGQPWISLIELGKFIPAPAQLARLARAFDIAPEDVLKPVTITTRGPADAGELGATP